MKNLLPLGSELPITRLVKNLMNDVTSVADMTSFDPKARKLNSVSKGRSFDEAIVFIVGGGNYTEYANLQDYATKSERTIVYGTSEMMSPSELVRQLSELGRS